MTTRKEQLEEALTEAGETPTDLEAILIKRVRTRSWEADKAAIERVDWDDVPTREFHSGYGGTEGEPCIAFTKNHVYICIEYDGSEWMEAIPRNPDAVKTIPWPGG